MTATEREAVIVMAKYYRWDKLSAKELALALWALFRYYAIRCVE